MKDPISIALVVIAFLFVIVNVKIFITSSPRQPRQGVRLIFTLLMLEQIFSLIWQDLTLDQSLSHFAILSTLTPPFLFFLLYRMFLTRRLAFWHWVAPSLAALGGLAKVVPVPWDITTDTLRLAYFLAAFSFFDLGWAMVAPTLRKTDLYFSRKVGGLTLWRYRWCAAGCFIQTVDLAFHGIGSVWFGSHTTYVLLSNLAFAMAFVPPWSWLDRFQVLEYGRHAKYLVRKLSVEDLATQLMAGVKQVVGCDTVLAAMLDTDQTRLVLRDPEGANTPAVVLLDELPPESPIPTAWRANKPALFVSRSDDRNPLVLIRDWLMPMRLDRDEAEAAWELGPVLNVVAWRYAIAVPIKTDEHIFGVLVTLHANSTFFPNEDLGWLVTLANNTALRLDAIEAPRLPIAQ